MKKYFLLFFIYSILALPFAFNKVEKTPYIIEIPKFVYKMINKHKIFQFEYICNKKNIFFNQSYVKFQRTKKKKIFEVINIVPGRNFFFTASKFVEIWYKNKIYTLFPEKQKGIKWNTIGFIKIIPVKGKLKISKKSHGNRVLDRRIFFKYKFKIGMYEGYIYKSKKGKIGEIHFIYGNKIIKFNFISGKKVNIAYKGRYLIENKLVKIFKKESNFFKDKLEKYGQDF